MAEKSSEKLAEFLAQEKLQQNKTAFDVGKITHLTDLSTKSKLITFWLSFFIPGAGYIYLNAYLKGAAVFLTCFILSVIALASLAEADGSIAGFFWLLEFTTHFFSIIFALSKVDAVRNEARFQLAEYYQQRQKI